MMGNLPNSSGLLGLHALSVGFIGGFGKSFKGEWQGSCTVQVMAITCSDNLENCGSQLKGADCRPTNDALTGDCRCIRLSDSINYADFQIALEEEQDCSGLSQGSMTISKLHVGQLVRLVKVQASRPMHIIRRLQLLSSVELADSTENGASFSRYSVLGNPSPVNTDNAYPSAEGKAKMSTNYQKAHGIQTSSTPSGDSSAAVALRGLSTSSATHDTQVGFRDSRSTVRQKLREYDSAKASGLPLPTPSSLAMQLPTTLPGDSVSGSRPSCTAANSAGIQKSARSKWRQPRFSLEHTCVDNDEYDDDSSSRDWIRDVTNRATSNSDHSDSEDSLCESAANAHPSVDTDGLTRGNSDITTQIVRAATGRPSLDGPAPSQYMETTIPLNGSQQHTHSDMRNHLTEVGDSNSWRDVSFFDLKSTNGAFQSVGEQLLKQHQEAVKMAEDSIRSAIAAKNSLQKLVQAQKASDQMSTDSKSSVSQSEAIIKDELKASVLPLSSVRQAQVVSQLVDVQAQNVVKKLPKSQFAEGPDQLTGTPSPIPKSSGNGGGSSGTHSSNTLSSRSTPLFTQQEEEPLAENRGVQNILNSSNKSSSAAHLSAYGSGPLRRVPPRLVVTEGTVCRTRRSAVVTTASPALKDVLGQTDPLMISKHVEDISLKHADQDRSNKAPASIFRRAKSDSTAY